ncbi:hypothetical protein HYPSUDRAFT_141011 [Hypholoma sublateritium FD-334 SS-4]|uniref:Gelsolin-like domain-containing protein n=1 Tax=Hypholoma sublateritium (strain FD-334 SS-4) TaxID=945553 RepID=A0A0D2NR66_HYPSF|nr:hypothetical protein HYPSUDRAFT_141011 [Hypholoma sublateritium FD-334 SS-4]
MAHSTKETNYDIEDSNIALLGSDLEKHVRETSGEHESAWEYAGAEIGLQIWRIEKFRVVLWPKDKHGSFYDGDSYIVLHTYKRTPEAESFSYNLHFWLGQNTTQDEAGTAAYKAVEFDDFLHGKPVQTREVQGYESDQFISYFAHFVCLQGGVSTGFHHISDPLPLNIRKLYRFNFSRNPGGGGSHLVVREVPATAESLVEGNVYVLDKGAEIFQLNTKASTGQERFHAAEFVQRLINERQNQSSLTVFDEGGSGVHKFFSEFGENVSLGKVDTSTRHTSDSRPVLCRISDATGMLTFAPVELISFKESFRSDDAFLLDASTSPRPAIFVWIGSQASLSERRLSLQYAQKYLYETQQRGEINNRKSVAIPIIKIQEGEETSDFLQVI